MRFILFLVFLLFFHNSNAQVSIGVFNEKERGYFQTLVALADYLKKEKTPAISLHESEFYSKEEALYDTVINTFFEKEKMLKAFEKDTLVFSVKGKLDMIRHILYGCDQSLDTLHPDSILIEPYRHSSNSLNYDDNLHRSLNVFIRKDNKKNHMLTWFFDEQTNKILGVTPIMEALKEKN